MEDILLTKEDVTAYINKLIVACKATKPVAIQERTRSTVDYTTQMANVKIKFSESGVKGGSVSMWIHLYDTITIYLNYVVSDDDTDVVLQVTESNFRILDVGGDFKALVINASNLLNTMQFRTQVIASQKVLAGMTAIDELLENV